jgi:hypothetical protein
MILSVMPFSLLSWYAGKIVGLVRISFLRTSSIPHRLSISFKIIGSSFESSLCLSHGIWSEATVNELSVKVKVPVIAALATVKATAFRASPVLLRLYFQLMPFYQSQSFWS